jgi:hypothetical protein
MAQGANMTGADIKAKLESLTLGEIMKTPARQLATLFEAALFLVKELEAEVCEMRTIGEISIETCNEVLQAVQRCRKAAAVLAVNLGDELTTITLNKMRHVHGAKHKANSCGGPAERGGGDPPEPTAPVGRTDPDIGMGSVEGPVPGGEGREAGEESQGGGAREVSGTGIDTEIRRGVLDSHYQRQEKPGR